MLEWDEQKDRQNRLKHGLSFEEVGELLTGDADYLEIYDVNHSVEEDRFIAIGPIRSGVVTVSGHSAMKILSESSAPVERPRRNRPSMRPG